MGNPVRADFKNPYLQGMANLIKDMPPIEQIKMYEGVLGKQAQLSKLKSDVVELSSTQTAKFSSKIANFLKNIFKHIK